MVKDSNYYLKPKSKLKYLIFLCLYFVLYPLAKLLYGRKNNWIICERGDDAQDNGFIFFKYIVENHAEINITYLIKKSSSDYRKVKSIGKTVEFCSFKHLLMAIGCPVKISSHLFGYAPWSSMTVYFRSRETKHKHIFLQHGITKNSHVGFYKETCRSLDLFVCGAKPEYEFINKEFHYNNNVPQYTGFARYDLLMNYTIKNQILFMPTWRAKLANCNDAEFIQSRFFINWNNLINNKDILDRCRKGNTKIIVYLHYSLQKFSHLFMGNDVVEVVKYGEQTVQNLLKESKLLVTDFSSVYFDFAYMHKPMVFFQFDEDTFYDEHYTKGYFDYRRDGFGDVCLDVGAATKSILTIIDNNYAMENKYESRIDRFFIYRDDKNCERIYKAIMAIK